MTQDGTHRQRRESFLNEKETAARAALPDDPDFGDYLEPHGEYDLPIYTGLLHTDDGMIDRIVDRRAEWITAKCDVGEKLAFSIAATEMGIPDRVAEKFDVSKGTASKYISRVEDTLGVDVLVAGPFHEIDRELDVGAPDVRECPECGKDRMVSLRQFEAIFPIPSDALARAFDGATSTGATHICSGCNTPQRLGGVDADGDDGPTVTGYYGRIPEELQAIDRWLIWEERGRDGSTTKIPIAPWATDGFKPVNAQNPFVWTSFDSAADWAQKTPGYGLEFVIRPDDPYVLVDLDDCVTGGDIDEDARAAIDRFDSYAEFSPSGTGVHIIVKGEVPSGYRNVEGFEIYDGARPCTFTGNTVRTVEVREAQDAIDEFCEKFLDDAPGSAVTADVIDGDRSADHCLASLRVVDVFDELVPGENAEHPVHGSTSDPPANFRPHADNDGSTAICWRCKVGLNAGHLIAMLALDVEECDEIRYRWDTDDEVVLEAWIYAVEELGIGPTPPPSRAILALARKAGMDPDDDYQLAWDTGAMIAQKRHGIDVETGS